MEGPLLTKIDGDFSSNDEHIIDMIIANEQTPYRDDEFYAEVWNLIEFVLTLVQIVAAIVVLAQAKVEHPQIWIVAYTFGCICLLPLQCWRFCRCICSASDTR